MSTPILALQLANSLSSICGTMSEHLKMARRTQPVENNSDSQSFQPEYHQIKKLGFKINKKKISCGGWSTHENQVYLQFMRQNSQDFMSESSRRKSKVFYRLSKILKRRTPDQCRSHHQKLQLKYKEDLKAIINQVERKVHTCALQDYLSQQQLFRRGQPRPQQPLPLPTEKSPEERHFKTISKASWYKLKSSGSCFKLLINSDCIGEW